MLWNWYTLDACFLSPAWQITSHAAFAATCIGKEFDSYVLRDFQARLSVISTDTRGTDPRQLLYGRHRCSSSFAQSSTPRLSVLRTSSFASSLGPGWVSSSVTRLETRLLGG